jgi:hypothetical protein
MAIGHTQSSQLQPPLLISMGVLSFLAVPIRRLLHDQQLVTSIIQNPDQEKAVYLWGHAKGAIVWTILCILLAVLTLCALAMLAVYYMVPFKSAKEWQRARIGGDQQSVRFRWTWIILLVIAGLITVDAMWSNGMSLRLYGITDSIINVVGMARDYLATTRKSAIEGLQFTTGIIGSMVGAAADGKDLRATMEVATDTFVEIQGLASFVTAQSAQLLRMAKSVDPRARGMVEAAVSALGMDHFKDVTALMDLSGKITNGTEEMMKNLASAVPPPELVLEHMSRIASISNAVELVRFIVVLLTLISLVGVIVGGFQFFRMRRFRLVTACMLLAIVLMMLMQLQEASHLILGVMMGSACDAIYSTGGQPPIPIGNFGGVPLNSAHVYQMVSSCANGHDLFSAALNSLADDRTQMVFRNNVVTLDPKNNHISVKTPAFTVTFTVKDGKSIDYTSAIEDTLKQGLGTASPELIRIGKDAANGLTPIASTLAKLDYGEIRQTIQAFRSQLSYLDSADVDDAFKQTLKTVKTELLQRSERILKLVDRMEKNAPELMPAVQSLISFFGTAESDPEKFTRNIEKALLAEVPSFVARSVSPIVNCQKIGAAVDGVIGTFCSAANGLQALFLSFFLLIIITTGLVVCMFICRKFAPVIPEE